MIRARTGNTSGLAAWFHGTVVAREAARIAAAVETVARETAVELANATFPQGQTPPQVALAAIAEDVCRVFATAGEIFEALRTRRSPRTAAAFYRAWKSGNLADAKRILQQAGGEFATLEFGSPSGALHEAARSGPRRRVSLPFPIRIVSRPDRDAFIFARQAELGKAAAGWSACAAELGSESGIPHWKSTSRHGHAGGSVERLSSTIRIGMILRNHAPNLSRLLPASTAFAVTRASRKRLSDLIRS